MLESRARLACNGVGRLHSTFNRTNADVGVTKRLASPMTFMVRTDGVAHEANRITAKQAMGLIILDGRVVEAPILRSQDWSYMKNRKLEESVVMSIFFGVEGANIVSS